MKKFLACVGVVVFWTAWPALWVYLRRGKRTRALVICSDEFLVLKGWLGAGDWILSGGGLHKGENSLQGLIREVAEETGIELFEKDTRFLFGGTTTNKGLVFAYDCFVVRLTEKPVVRLQKYEISDYTWQPLDNPKNLSHDAQEILDTWKNKG